MWISEKAFTSNFTVPSCLHCTLPVDPFDTETLQEQAFLFLVGELTGTRVFWIHLVTSQETRASFYSRQRRQQGSEGRRGYRSALLEEENKQKKMDLGSSVCTLWFMSDITACQPSLSRQRAGHLSCSVYLSCSGEVDGLPMCQFYFCVITQAKKMLPMISVCNTAKVVKWYE